MTPCAGEIVILAVLTTLSRGFRRGNVPLGDRPVRGNRCLCRKGFGLSGSRSLPFNMIVTGSRTRDSFRVDCEGLTCLGGCTSGIGLLRLVGRLGRAGAFCCALYLTNSKRVFLQLLNHSAASIGPLCRVLIVKSGVTGIVATRLGDGFPSLKDRWMETQVSNKGYEEGCRAGVGHFESEQCRTRRSIITRHSSRGYINAITGEWPSNRSHG